MDIASSTCTIFPEINTDRNGIKSDAKTIIDHLCGLKMTKALNNIALTYINAAPDIGLSIRITIAPESYLIVSYCKQLGPCHMMGSRYIRASNMSATHRLLH